MDHPSFPALPSEVEFVLATGIGRLLINRYKPNFGEEEAVRLAAGILNFSFLMEPGGEGIRYGRENATLIEQQSKSLHLDEQLADAMSLLYSFMLVRIGPTDPDRTIALSERATELSLFLRTTEEIYPTREAGEFLDYVRKYALGLVSK